MTAKITSIESLIVTAISVGKKGNIVKRGKAMLSVNFRANVDVDLIPGDILVGALGKFSAISKNTVINYDRVVHVFTVPSELELVYRPYSDMNPMPQGDSVSFNQDKLEMP